MKRLKKIAENNVAKQIYDKLDKDKVYDALGKDNKYYVKQFLDYVEDHSDNFIDEDYVDDSDYKDFYVSDLKEAYVDYMKDNDTDMSDVDGMICEIAEDMNIEPTYELVDEVAKYFGYDTIGEFIADNYDGDFEDIESDLKDHARDLAIQQKDTEEMRRDSYNW